MTYTASVNVTGNVDDVLASQINNLRAELKAATDGESTHDVDITIAYSGWKISTVTYVDTQGDSDLDFDAVSTYTYTGLKPTTIATVFSAMGVTMTEVISYTGWKATGIARTLS